MYWTDIITSPLKIGLAPKGNTYIYIHIIIYIYYIIIVYIPVVPHKAVAEVSRIGNYRRDWLL